MSKYTPKSARTCLAGLVALLLFTGAGKCTPDLGDPQACLRLTTEQTERFVSARLALEPWHEELMAAGGGRSPASDRSIEEPYLSPLDREAWGKWARTRLEEVENSIDALPVYQEFRPVRMELSSLAKGLVEFHAFTGRGRVSRMLGLLDEMKESSQRAARLLCAEKKR